MLTALGVNYLSEGTLDAAETLFNKALEMFGKTSHLEIYVVLENLSALYAKRTMQAHDVVDSGQRQNFKTKAIDYLKQADEIITTRFTQPSPHSTRVQFKLKELEQI